MIRLFETQLADLSKIRLETEVLRTGLLSEGKEAKITERLLQSIIQNDNTFLVNSGTSALHLALILAGVKPGDEVILPAQTFIATGLAVLYCGAKPVFADILMDGTIDPNDVYRKLNNHTRAIIGVDWAGYPCNRFLLRSIAKIYDSKVIIDAAHSFGAQFDGTFVGHFDADFVCFSFQAIKLVTSGDGGAVACADRGDYERGKKLRWFGIDRETDVVDETGERKYNLTEIGYKYHMNDISAAILHHELEDWHNRVFERRLNGLGYYSQLSSVPGIQLLPYTDYIKSNYWLFPLLADNRNGLRRKLLENGIESSVVHQGIDRNDIFGGIDESLVRQREFDKHLLHIPVHQYLTVEEILKIVNVIKSGW